MNYMINRPWGLYEEPHWILSRVSSQMNFLVGDPGMAPRSLECRNEAVGTSIILLQMLNSCYNICTTSNIVLGPD